MTIEKSIDRESLDKFLLFLVCWGTPLPSSGQITIWCEIMGKLKWLQGSQTHLNRSILVRDGSVKTLRGQILNKKRFINFSAHVYDALWKFNISAHWVLLERLIGWISLDFLFFLWDINKFGNSKERDRLYLNRDYLIDLMWCFYEGAVVRWILSISQNKCVEALYLVALYKPCF